MSTEHSKVRDTTPSPEVKEIISEFVRIQKERYGENWKEILSKEMAKKTTDALRQMGLFRTSADASVDTSQK